MRTLRVGNCSGFYGDRFSAMREMLEGGELDYLTGDYLAELTMLILGRDRMKSPDLGYAKTFLKQVSENLALAKERGVKIVANAGGLNPAGLAAALRDVATEQGIDVKVAHVEGDDLGARSAELGFGDAITANAYLGAFGIAEALTAGADIVVTGRVTDASVVVGPAIAEFGWDREDFDRVAGAVVAGHVIECGAQATGGNFSGFLDIDVSTPLGFPIAEIAENGEVVITKHEGTGGAVTVDTVTAQLVYEIQDERYLNPDVVVDLTTIRLDGEGDDRVRISGVRGSAPPSTTKVCLNAFGGFRNSVEFVLTGLDIEEKAAWVRRQVETALAANPPAEIVWDLMRTDRPDPATQPQSAAILRCSVKDADQNKVGRAFSGAAVEVGLASYPGFTLTAPPGRGAPYGIYRAAYVPQAEVPHVVVHHDGSRTEIDPPQVTSDAVPARGLAPTPAPAFDGATREIELGRLVHARSGDKGGNANVGVWVPAAHPQRGRAHAWLESFLTADRVKQLLPEAADLDVVVHPLPNLAGVNILIHGLLGEGVASSTRFDPQAKAVGEWLRARVVTIPEELLGMTADTWNTPERQALRTAVEDFTRAEIVPSLPQWEDDGQLPRELHRTTAKAGFLAIGVPEEVGGDGGDMVDACIAAEAMIHAGGSSGLQASLFTHSIATPHIIDAGSPDLIDRYVRPTLAGEKIGSLGVTEPGGGSDVANITTRAVRDGDHFVVNGAKTFITSGVRADFVTTAVRTGDAGHGGISLLVIDKDTPGFTVGRSLRKMGWHCSDTAELSFEDVRVPVENLVGEENFGFYYIAQQFVSERINLATQAHATAQRSLDLAVEYARQRETFGKPLIARQVIRHKLVEMHSRTAAARALTHQVVERSLETDKSDPNLILDAVVAKNVAVACAEFVVHEAVQIFGGMGYMRESEIDRHYRDARILGIGGGATEVMKDLASKLLGY